MSRKCELTGKTVQVGNNVSHAKNRTKRRFLPNLSNVTLNSELLGRSFKFKVATSALRTVDAKGGLDPFLIKAKDDVLSANALKIKRQIVSTKVPLWTGYFGLSGFRFTWRMGQHRKLDKKYVNDIPE